MEQKSYSQKEISIMFDKSLALLAHYKKELIEKGYMYKNQKGRNVINEEGVDYLRKRFAEIDQSKRKGRKEKEEKIVLEQEVQILQREKEWYKDKMEYYKNQAEDWKKQAENWKDEKIKESKDKEIWREMAIKNEQLIIENQRMLNSSKKTNIFKKLKRRAERGNNERA